LTVFLCMNKGSDLEIDSGVSEMFISPKTRRRSAKPSLSSKERIVYSHLPIPTAIFLSQSTSARNLSFTITTPILYNPICEPLSCSPLPLIYSVLSLQPRATSTMQSHSVSTAKVTRLTSRRLSGPSSLPKGRRKRLSEEPT